ncbi:MAG: hypothetical protein ABSA16_11615, partial [Thermoguttaceae bacterium]
AHTGHYLWFFCVVKYQVLFQRQNFESSHASCPLYVEKGVKTRLLTLFLAQTRLKELTGKGLKTGFFASYAGVTQW